MTMASQSRCSASRRLFLEALSRAKVYARSVVKNKPVYLLIGILTAFLFSFGAFFEEEIVIFAANPLAVMGDAEFYLTYILVLLLAASLLLVAHRFYDLRINWIFFGIASALFICDLIATFAFSDSFTISLPNASGDLVQIVYLLNWPERIRYVTSFSFTCVLLYIIFAVLPKILRDPKQLTAYFYGGLVVAFALIVYSYIAEWPIYFQYFNPSSVVSINVAPQSFTNNRNTYGIMLLIGIICGSYLQVQNHRWWFCIPAIFFYLNEFFILSKTSLLIATAFLAVFFIYRYVKDLSLHLIMDNVLLALALAFLAFFIWFIGSGTVQYIPFLDKIVKNTLSTFETVKDTTLISRLWIWQTSVSLQGTNLFYVIFGFGYGNYGYLLGQAVNGFHSLGYAHLGLLQIMGRFGLIGLIIYLAMLIYIFTLLLKGIGRKDAMSAIGLMAFIAILLHGLTESTAFLGGDTKSLFAMIIVFLPALVSDYQSNHPEIVQVQMSMYSSPFGLKADYPVTDSQAARMAFFLMTPVYLILIGTTHVFHLADGVALFDGVWPALSLTVLFLIIPKAVGDLHSFYRFVSDRFLIIFSAASGVCVFALAAIAVTLPEIWSFLIVAICAAGLLFAIHWLSRKFHEPELKEYLLKVYLPYVSIAASLLLANLLLAYLVPQPSVYFGLVLAFIDLVAFLLIAAYSPLSSRLAYPFNLQWLFIERWAFAANIRWELGLTIDHRRTVAFHRAAYKKRLQKAKVGEGEDRSA